MRKSSMSLATERMLEIGLFFVLAAMVAILGIQSVNAVRAQQSLPSAEREQLPLPPVSDQNLFFSENQASLTAAQVSDRNLLSEQAKVVATERLIQLDNHAEPTDTTHQGQKAVIEVEAEGGHGGGTVIVDNFPSPDGRRLIVQTWMGGTPLAWLLNLEDRANSQLVRLTPEGYGIVLAWHPDSRQVLYNVRELGVPDPGLWIVDTWDGKHRRLEVPGLVASQGLLAASFSPDGSRIVYATTRGMGFGSEVWTVNVNGTDHKLILKDEERTVSGVKWSPNGQKIAFVYIPDSPVPFAEGGLWHMNVDGTDARFLALMDGGRGQMPVWSQDGQHLYFVARENSDDSEATYQSELLVSSIRSIHVETSEETILVPAEGARQIDLSLTPEGQLLFGSNRAGDALEVWTVGLNAAPRQITSDGADKRHPIFVPSHP